MARMNARSLLHRVQWEINAIRHRDPLSPRRFVRLFGSRRRRSWDPTQEPRRVVILRSDEIGDTVSTLTLLDAMRRQWPSAKLHLVVKPGPGSAFHAAPSVDRLIFWSPITEGSALKRQILTVRQALRRFGLRGYDLAVLPRWDFDDTPIRYLAVAARARSVVGFTPVPQREPDWLGDQSALFTDELPRGNEPLLTVAQLRRLADWLGLAWTHPGARPVGRALFDAADAARAEARASLPGESGRVIGLGIGARDAKRQWPVERLTEAVVEIAKSGPVRVRILGGPTDRERAAELVGLLRDRGIAAVDLAGELSLSESAAAISQCDLFIGNDSGLQHISSSLDVPTVVVTCHPATGSPWSDNAPERFGPWSRQRAVLQPERPAPGCGEECSSREPHCILAVDSADVAGAALALISESSRPSETPASAG